MKVRFLHLETGDFFLLYNVPRLVILKENGLTYFIRVYAVYSYRKKSGEINSIGSNSKLFINLLEDNECFQYKTKKQKHETRA
jgi:hypothetical protein